MSCQPSPPRASLSLASCSSLMRRASGALAWKPMLMRWAMCSVSLRRLDDLGEHAARGGRVQEGDARPADPDARLLVDELQATRAQRAERRLHVVDLVGDVVQ